MRPLHIIGTSADTDLSAAALAALQQAQVIIGSPHQFVCVEQHLAHSRAHRSTYPSPLAKLNSLIDAHSEQQIVLLASGDPLFYGIGAWLRRNFAASELRFYPNVSSIQSAFARLGKPWQQAEVISLHGRPLTSLNAVLVARSLYAVLTDDANTPARIAQALLDLGFADSQCWVCENLGGADEQIKDYAPASLAQVSRFHPLNVLIIETGNNRGYLPEFPGITDADFITGTEPGKGMLSKREVRLNVLALLAPQAGDCGWDVGAGCGGVAVEWARWNARGRVHAIEHHNERLSHLHTNRERFGVVRNLNIIEGKAPRALTDLPDPDAVFIGGSSGDLHSTLELCWQRLKPGGRLACAAVTEDTRYRLYQFAEQLETADCEYVEIGVSRGGELGGRLVLRPQMPVLLVRWRKAWTDENVAVKTRKSNADGSEYSSENCFGIRGDH